MKLYRFKFLTAEILGTMGTSFGRSDFRDLLGGQGVSYDWSMSRRYSKRPLTNHK